MTDFTFHTAETASDASKPLIAAAKSAYGFIPNLLAGMAEAPALLEGYMTLAGIFNKTELNETERQIIMMTNNRLNGCTYCMAAHTTISQGAKVAEDVIAALRNNTAISDPKLEALRQFSIAVNESRGWVKQHDLDAFLAAGYTQQTVLEVILGTSLKVMSNYTNHITQTPVDSAFKANAWSADESEAA
ncbi:carboxymuconolactone decarboxylase family protein [Photobacterium alginatilyticum]|uniref:Carboxymuconolactone decarboxylase family protein n=1 Tax=Photobacterium alginatilyticum TaxID=1775171 RepID=A0ABW9YP42_9GAMM|nr:carboxymuconolactone decarboxylase family protein [Photobacterium alginatilyticum]NBI55425.1 carboxymuconolactone decarboxylase family protein [Photobacterium alginatilyticum]